MSEMKVELSYLEATRIKCLYLWEIKARDRENNEINFFIRYIRNKPEPRLTYIEAKDVVGEIKGDCLFLLDEVILQARTDWVYDPDHPDNLAKTVTVK